MLKASPELRLCADAHEAEVITNDSYNLESLVGQDIQYIVDIGANIGAFSTHAHQLFPSAKIISCEPEQSMMKYVKENTNDELIYVEKAIIGDSNLKEVKFNICQWEGNHHVDGVFNMEAYEPVGSRIVSSIIVSAMTLKEIIDQNSFPRIDILKIDTEGCEPEILESYKPWLNSVKWILAEWHSQKDLIKIKEILATRNTTYIDGAFKEPGTELPANGTIISILK